MTTCASALLGFIVALAVWMWPRMVRDNDDA
jgi:hypothetical protein